MENLFASPLKENFLGDVTRALCARRAFASFVICLLPKYLQKRTFNQVTIGFLFEILLPEIFKYKSKTVRSALDRVP